MSPPKLWACEWSSRAPAAREKRTREMRRISSLAREPKALAQENSREEMRRISCEQSENTSARCLKTQKAREEFSSLAPHLFSCERTREKRRDSASREKRERARVSAKRNTREEKQSSSAEGARENSSAESLAPLAHEKRILCERKRTLLLLLFSRFARMSSLAPYLSLALKALERRVLLRLISR